MRDGHTFRTFPPTRGTTAQSVFREKWRKPLTDKRIRIAALQ
jgi:hypothetical protein